ncbi:MAG: ABC transporter ATP-binding protein [Phycisphaerae bacterium]|nr:ABC transporter ATP-binding protein [Phycisphaerae bacterium]
MNTHAVEIQGLDRRFGKQKALEAIDLSVPKGVVMGLVGENGAGKTTLIKHVLGLLKAQTGTVRVFGLDPVRSPAEVLGRIGYLSENRELPEWMRVGELLRYTQAFYPAWDTRYAQDLLGLFELRSDQRIKTLSRGQRAQTALLVALAYRPDLLLLDEPSSGLDPVVRRDILSAIVRTVADEGRTVVFSSHLLDEVERVADVVVMIHEGRIVLKDSLDQIKATHTRLTVRFPEAVTSPPTLPGVLSCSGGPQEWTYVCQSGLKDLQQGVEAAHGTIVDNAVPTLDEIFVSRAKGRPSPKEVLCGR